MASLLMWAIMKENSSPNGGNNNNININKESPTIGFLQKRLNEDATVEVHVENSVKEEEKKGGNANNTEEQLIYQDIAQESVMAEYKETERKEGDEEIKSDEEGEPCVGQEQEELKRR